MMQGYMAIEGCIGAGKTTLATRLAEKYSGKLVLEEFADNTFLEKFYENPERYAFPLEVSFLVERFQQLKVTISNADLFQQFSASDYLFDKSLVFARINLADDQFHLFAKLFESLRAQLPRPSLVVYLYNTVENLQKNIKKRGRHFEQKIPDKYLTDLQRSYLGYLRSMRDQAVLLLDISKVDFVEQERHFARIIEIVSNAPHNGFNTVEL